MLYLIIESTQGGKTIKNVSF